MQESKQEGPRTSDDPGGLAWTAFRKRCRDRNGKESRGLKPERGSTRARQNGLLLTSGDKPNIAEQVRAVVELEALSSKGTMNR